MQFSKRLKLRIIVPALLLSILVFFLLYLSELDERSNQVFRGDSQFAINNCWTFNEHNKIFKTAAGFKMAVPIWMQSPSPESSFNSECELTRIILRFAIVENSLKPLRGLGIPHPKEAELPDFYSQLTLYLRFSAPIKNELRPTKNNVPDLMSCDNKEPLHKFPQYNIVMCPSLKERANIPYGNLPFLPMFEIIDDKPFPTYFKCLDKLKEHSIDRIEEAYVTYGCRGSWYWRNGARAMFDMHRSEVIKQTSDALRQVEPILNSWVLD